MDDCLPALTGVRNELRWGRSVYEGYQRSWGLEFGDLKTHILAEADFLILSNIDCDIYRSAFRHPAAC